VPLGRDDYIYGRLKKEYPSLTKEEYLAYAAAYRATPPSAVPESPGPPGPAEGPLTASGNLPHPSRPAPSYFGRMRERFVPDVREMGQGIMGLAGTVGAMGTPAGAFLKLPGGGTAGGAALGLVPGMASGAYQSIRHPLRTLREHPYSFGMSSLAGGLSGGRGLGGLGRAVLQRSRGSLPRIPATPSPEGLPPNLAELYEILGAEKGLPRGSPAAMADLWSRHLAETANLPPLDPHRGYSRPGRGLPGLEPSSPPADILAGELFDALVGQERYLKPPVRITVPKPLPPPKPAGIKKGWVEREAIPPDPLLMQAEQMAKEIPSAPVTPVAAPAPKIPVKELAAQMKESLAKIPRKKEGPAKAVPKAPSTTPAAPAPKTELSAHMKTGLGIKGKPAAKPEKPKLLPSAASKDEWKVVAKTDPLVSGKIRLPFAVIFRKAGGRDWSVFAENSSKEAAQKMLAKRQAMASAEVATAEAAREVTEKQEMGEALKALGMKYPPRKNRPKE